MEKITCEVINDLLPLYCDGVCAEDSRRLVERHLKGCAYCRSVLEKMRDECSIEYGRQEEGEHIIKGMAAVWKKSVWKSFLIGIAAASVLLLSALACYLLTSWPFVCIPPKQVEASAVVEGSRYIVHLDTANRYKVPSVDLETTEDGILYIVLKRALAPVRFRTEKEHGGIYAGSMDSETRAGKAVKIRAIYYGTQDECELLWEEP